MNGKRLKQLNVLVILVVLAGLICAGLFVFVFSPKAKEKTKGDNLRKYNEGWVLKQYRDETDRLISLPVRISSKKNETIVIMNRLPEDTNSSSVLMFWTEYQSVIVSIDGSNVYSYGVLSEQPIMKAAVPNYNIVDIGDAKPGSVVAIYLTSPYNNAAGNISDIYFGTRGDAISHIISKNGISFVCAAIILVITIMLTIFLLTLKDLKVSKDKVLYAFSFVIMTCVWHIFDNKMIDLLIPNNYGTYMISAVLLLILPVMYSMYYRSVVTKKLSMLFFEISIYAYAVNFLTGCVFQLLNVVDFAYYMIFTKILIVLWLMGATYILFASEERKKEKNNFIAHIIVTISCLAEVILSLFDFYNSYEKMVLSAGILIFTIMFVISAQKQIIDGVNKEKVVATSGEALEKDIILNKINTNFIYSSFNTVISNLKDSDRANSRLVYDTSIYLKHNMEVIANKNVVSFSKEFEYIRAYLGVMNSKHKDLEVVIEDKVTYFHVPYNTIEPLVENAVMNGALKATNSGKIVFRCYERLDCFAIQIIDNGPGISPDKKFYGKESYKDIKKRLKSAMGAVIEINAKADKGTILTVKIPKKGFVIKEMN